MWTFMAASLKNEIRKINENPSEDEKIKAYEYSCFANFFLFLFLMMVRRDPAFRFVFVRDGSAHFAPTVACRVQPVKEPAFRFAGS